MIDKHEPVGGDLAELEAERVDPEIVRSARHAETDVARDALVHAVTGEDSITGGELDLELAGLGGIGELAGALALAVLGGSLQPPQLDGFDVGHRSPCLRQNASGCLSAI